MSSGRRLTTDDLRRQDEAQLHALGYAQELYRAMGGFSNFAISFTIISVLSGCLTLFSSGLNSAGPAAGSIGWPLAFHLGQERRHLDEWWGQHVSLDFLFFETAQVEEWLAEACFLLEARLERQPYEPYEVATRRAYVLARKPTVGPP